MFTYAMKSKPGDRAYNEDYIQMHSEGDDALFVLCDGLGGMGHGEIASETAVRGAISRFRQDRSEPGFFERMMEGSQNAVLTKQMMNPELKNMSTTMTALRIKDDTASWAHIGDSRLYMFRDGAVVHQTEDHSVPQMLVRMGDITTDEIRHHPDRNRLLYIIGKPWTEKRYVIGDPVKVRKGDAFLLCSDGFWEYIQEKEMVRLLESSADCSEWLARMQKVVEKNGAGSNMDNYSAICVQIREV